MVSKYQLPDRKFEHKFVLTRDRVRVSEPAGRGFLPTNKLMNIKKRNSLQTLPTDVLSFCVMIGLLNIYSNKFCNQIAHIYYCSHM